MQNKLYNISECLDDDNNIYEILETDLTLFQAECKLTYYLNRGHDAYLEEKEL